VGPGRGRLFALRVVESLEQTKAALRFKAPKTEKSRVVTLPSFVIEELRRLKRQQAEELLALGVRQSGETLACSRHDGEPMLPRSLTHEFAKVAGRVQDVPRVRFHDLRHSHATQLLSAGVHPKVAQERLGTPPSPQRWTFTPTSRRRCRGTRRPNSTPFSRLL
jgi:integrase